MESAEGTGSYALEGPRVWLFVGTSPATMLIFLERCGGGGRSVIRDIEMS